MNRRITFSVGWWFAAMLLATNTGAQVLFTEGATLGTGSTRSAGVVHDFDGDGIADVAIAGYHSGDIGIFIGNGDRTFQTPVTRAAGAFPGEMALSDVDQNGLADLVVVNRSGEVSALLSNGDGTFRRLTSAVGPVPEFLAVADLDGDTVPDVVTGSDLQGRRVLLGNGDGTFQPPTALSGGQIVRLADLDGDGVPDLITSFRTPFGQHVGVRLGNGDGRFAVGTSYTVYDSGTSLGTTRMEDIRIGLVDGDANLDLVATSSRSDRGIQLELHSHLLLGNGDGTLQPAVPLAPLNTAIGGLADLDGDTSLDLLVSNTRSNFIREPIDLGVMRGNGDGTFQTPVLISEGLATDILVARIDGDTIPDLLTGQMQLYPGNGDGSFQDAIVSARFEHAIDEIVATDFDGDGDVDIVAADPDTGDVLLLAGNGDGTFKGASTFVGGGARAVAVADFDGDLISDIATADGTSDEVSVLLGNADGSLQPPSSFPAGDGPISLAVGLFDSDTRPDVVVVNETGSDVRVLLAQTDGSLSPAGSFDAGDLPRAVATADLDGDGVFDIVTAATEDNAVAVLMGNGGGDFDAPFFASVGERPVDVLIADIDDDTIPDIMTANIRTDDVSVLVGIGDGTFESAQHYPLAPPRALNGFRPISIAVSDLDLDGDLDLAASRTTHGVLSVFRGRGDGTFFTADPYELLVETVSIAIADVNGDLRPDIITGGGGISILLNAPEPSLNAMIATALVVVAWRRRLVTSNEV